MNHRYYTEEDLLEGCRAGNSRFQQALFDRYSRKMFGVCLRYCDNRDDAQDVLQDGFIKVFGNLHQFRGNGSLEGWVRRVMVTTALEHYRRRSRYIFVETEEWHQVELNSDALSALGAAELTKLIQELPTGYRTVFNLYAIEGYTHEEIGGMLGISEGTSKSQLSRARKTLQDALGGAHANKHLA